MPPAKPESAVPLLLVCGEDEYSVKRRARQVFQEWCAPPAAVEAEQIDAAAANSVEALKAISRLHEALQTFPFFAPHKVIWFQNCSFLGDERAASTAAVTEALAGLAEGLKGFDWRQVRLLISAGKVDKRKSFFKTLEKVGRVESFNGWSLEDRDWAEQAELWARQELQTLGKPIHDEALSLLVASVGPNPRQLASEVEKLALYAAEAEVIKTEHVQAVVTRNRQARAFALGDALGDRNLPRALKNLNEELWSLRFDSQKSEIGLLYGLISKVRAMLLLKEMLREGWVKPESDYNRFKAQLQRVPAESLPADKRFNPLALNPYVLFKALPQAARYTSAELVRAMELLLESNQRLVTSALDEACVLQQALVQIVQGADDASPRPGRWD